jgi:hypothetical protein
VLVFLVNNVLINNGFREEGIFRKNVARVWLWNIVDVFVIYSFMCLFVCIIVINIFMIFSLYIYLYIIIIIIYIILFILHTNS